MELLPDWSGLPPELLEQIAKCLPLLEDFTAFRGVCTTWRGAVSKNKYQFKVPLLMLAEKHPSHQCKSYMRNLGRLYRIKMGDRIRKCKIHRLCRRKKKQEYRNHEREFYSLSKRKICARLPFPDAKNKKCIDVGFGWILAVSASKCSKLSVGDAEYGKHWLDDSDTKYGKFLLGDISDGKVSLVKPFYSSSPKIKLPNMRKCSKYKELWPDFAFFLRAKLLANPSETSDFTLVLLTHNFIVFWRNGDQNWTVINPDKFLPRYIDMVCYKGCVYAVDHQFKIWSWDLNGNDVTKAQVMTQLDYSVHELHSVIPYLVESTEGELLVIVRKFRRKLSYWRRYSYMTNYFRVMRVDIEARKMEEIKSVGEDAIFVGNNTTVAVAADDYPSVLKPNCIYFTDDFDEGYFGTPEFTKGGGKDMGIYSVENKRIKRLGIKSFSPISPPMWIFPSF